MSEERPEPLDPHLLELLRAHAPPLRAPAEAFERVAARLAVAVPGMDAGRGGDPRDPGAPSAPTPAGGRVVASGLGALGAKGLVPLALAFAVGAGAGVAVTRALQTPVERVVYVDRPAPAVAAPAVPVPQDVSASVPVESLPLAPSATPRARPSQASTAATAAVAPSASAAPTPSTDSIALERAVLDEARGALRRGDAAACLAAVDRHKARYPKGGLSEEREALAVSALVASGRTAEARERANAFVAEYPASLLRPAVEAAVSTAPDKP